MLKKMQNLGKKVQKIENVINSVIKLFFTSWRGREQVTAGGFGVMGRHVRRMVHHHSSHWDAFSSLWSWLCAVHLCCRRWKIKNWTFLNGFREAGLLFFCTNCSWFSRSQTPSLSSTLFWFSATSSTAGWQQIVTRFASAHAPLSSLRQTHFRLLRRHVLGNFPLTVNKSSFDIYT